MMNIPESSLNSVDLYCALMMGEIVPYYQPVIDARTQTLHGLEVLMRWALADVDATPVALISAFEEKWAAVGNDPASAAPGGRRY